MKRERTVYPIATWMVDGRKHLSFTCSAVKCIWSTILQICSVLRAVGDWDFELDFTKKFLQKRSLKAIMMRLAWCSYIYFVWQERNGRIHSSDRSAVSILVKQAIQSMWFKDPERCCWKPKFDRFLEQMGFATIHSDRVLMELQFNHTVIILELKLAWQAKLLVVTCTWKKIRKNWNFNTIQILIKAIIGIS